MKFKIFTDFDGTITKIDVGNLVFKTFAGRDIYPLIKDWKANLLTSKELLAKECEMANIKNLDELFSLVDNQTIDEYFVEFAKYCKEKEIDIFILSDGLDFYIKKILEKNNLDYIKFYSNKFNYKKNGNEKIVINPAFPYTDSECLLCGNCKRNHLIYHRADDELAVYIGDGYSDRCPAEFADIVFCKGELLSYCTSKKIPFYEFKNFSDIIIKLEELVSKKRLSQKKRGTITGIKIDYITVFI